MPIASDGTKRGLLVLNGTDGAITLPQNAQEIIKRQIELEDYIKNFVRIGGKGKLQHDGKIYYNIYAKADLAREITVTSDGSVVTDGMYGAESASTFGYIKPTTIVAYSDFVELTGGKFMKEIIMNKELEQENLPTLATDRISTHQNGIQETIIHDIKLAIVAAIGTNGKAATDAKWTPTHTRNIAKDYTIDEAGGLLAYNDIDTSLGHLLNIGRKGSAEESYPFARGSGASNVTLLLSRDVNRAISIAFKESPSGTFPGVSIDQISGKVTNLFGTKTLIAESMPEKATDNAFNWALITTGENGAIAMPSIFDTNFQIRPHYEGVASLANVIEGSGGSWGIKLFQPELIFGSFRTKVSPAPPTPRTQSKSN